MRACTSVELEFSEVTDQMCYKQTHRQPDKLTGDSQAGGHRVCAALRWMPFVSHFVQSLPQSGPRLLQRQVCWLEGSQEGLRRWRESMKRYMYLCTVRRYWNASMLQHTQVVLLVCASMCAQIHTHTHK